MFNSSQKIFIARPILQRLNTHRPCIPTTITRASNIRPTAPPAIAQQPLNTRILCTQNWNAEKQPLYGSSLYLAAQKQRQEIYKKRDAIYIKQLAFLSKLEFFTPLSNGTLHAFHNQLHELEADLKIIPIFDFLKIYGEGNLLRIATHLYFKELDRLSPEEVRLLLIACLHPKKLAELVNAYRTQQPGKKQYGEDILQVIRAAQKVKNLELAYKDCFKILERCMVDPQFYDPIFLYFWLAPPSVSS